LNKRRTHRTTRAGSTPPSPQDFELLWDDFIGPDYIFLGREDYVKKTCHEFFDFYNSKLVNSTSQIKCMNCNKMIDKGMSVTYCMECASESCT